LIWFISDSFNTNNSIFPAV